MVTTAARVSSGHAIASFKKLCIGATDPHRLGRFWAAVLDLEWRPGERGECGIFGPTEGHTIRVSQPKTVKHRVHLELYATSLEDLRELGSTSVLPKGDDRHWTVMADPEGGEYCAFLRDELPPDRLHGLVVDSADPHAQARWWASVYGGKVEDDDRGFATVTDVPGMPILTMDFVPVPEPKTVSNRVHWDLAVTEPQQLVDAGATLLRSPDGDIDWYVLADPEGNEFCAFTY